MARTRKWKLYAGDFETTVYEGQDHTEVWSACVCELYTDNIAVYHSLDEMWTAFEDLGENIICYFHNLKFDGHFVLSYLLRFRHYSQAYTPLTDDEDGPVEWIKEKDMKSKTVKYSISEMGQWYTLRAVTKKGKIIELRDSLKLLPFTLKRIGKSFGTKHKKLEMEYTGYRYAGCDISDEEMAYIKNDVYVLKEALEIMYDEGHSKLTIGSCCMDEYKNIIGKEAWGELFPNVYDIGLAKRVYGSDNAGEYIRHAYKGGWCYAVPEKTSKIYRHGVTADVNSLYPSVMSGESGNVYPVGLPHWFKEEIPDEARLANRYYFVRIRTRFYLKPGMLPFIQIKGKRQYRGTEMLTTSDVYNKQTGQYERWFMADGVKKEAIVELTLTCTDWKLLQEHYELPECEILDGCWFEAECGLFDDYINKYKEIKIHSKGAQRELAKLFLNNLYGKFAANDDSSFKVADIKPDGSLHFRIVEEYEKKPGYIPVGAAVTSYARNFTIRAAQKNFHGPDKPGFIYADTDSIHCDLDPDEVQGIKVHPTNFLCWKLEATWDIGWFVRQKTYIEHVYESDREPCEPFYNIKCAGMPEKCKTLFVKSITPGYTVTDEDKAQYNPRELSFIQTPRTIEDFNIGLVVPGKLRPTAIPGGVVLEDTDFTMRAVLLF